MHFRKLRSVAKQQAGFSMVEMLMAAFILGIGILGLTMLQTMSLRATRGSQNLGIAVQLAEQLMDEVELEGRLTYLNTNITQYTAPTALGSLKYINLDSVDQYYNINPSNGQLVKTGTAAGALFHVNMAQAFAIGTGLTDVTIAVDFTDGINASNNQAITRTARVTRRILHG